MAEVFSLPGVCRPDLIEDATPNDVLASAMELPLQDAVVVGRNLNGDIEVLSSQANADLALGLLMRGVNYLASSEQIDEPAESSA